MRKGKTIATVFITLCVAGLGSASTWGQTDEEIPWYEQRRGELRMGAYYLRNTNTHILIESTSNPLAATVNFHRELGLGAVETVPRLRFGYNFTARHRFDLSYFAVERDGERPVIDTEIGIGNITIPVGASVVSHFDSSILKLSYTNLFYRTDKVRLGFSAGVNFTSFDVGTSFVTTPSRAGEPAVFGEEQRDGTGPLPLIGGRLSYSISPRWFQITTLDVLSIDTGDYTGALTDLEVVVENRVSRTFGWGMGFQLIYMDLSANDGELAGTVQNSARGINLYATVYF